MLGNGRDVRGVAADAAGDAFAPPRTAAIVYVTSAGAARMDDVELMAQATAMTAFCARRNWDVAGIVHEVEAPRGKTLSRPALSYVRERLRSGEVSCLIVTELGRLCRSVAELREVFEAFDGAGGRLVVLEPALDTGTPEGRAVAGMLCAVSQWERRRVAARSRKGLAEARAKGAMRPGIEPQLKRRIARMRNAGMTLQAIVDELNEAGVPTVRGGAKWRPSSVQAAIGYRRPARG